MLCPCGSARKLTVCCQPFIRSSNNLPVQLPQSAEALMRSRFTAYALNNANYIYQTYAKSSQTQQRIEDIENWAQECIWLNLSINPVQTSTKLHDASEQSKKTLYHYVDFTATYLQGDQLNEMRENSRFLQELDENNQWAWRYLDGDIISHATLTSVKRNDTCPCQRYDNKQSTKAKKFKHCCGK